MPAIFGKSACMQSGGPILIAGYKRQTGSYSEMGSEEFSNSANLGTIKGR